MESGAVWMHRSADKNDVLRHPIRFSLFFRCVMRACWKERSVIYRGKQISLKRGQLAWSVRDMADGVGCSVKEIRTALKHLKMATMLDTEEGTVPQVVTVLNYNDYQSQIEKEGTTSGTNKGTVGAQEGHSRGTQNNKDKKDKKDNNYIPPISPQGADADIQGKTRYPSKTEMGKAKGKKPYPLEFEELWDCAFKRDEDKTAKADIYGHWLDGINAGHNPDDIIGAAKKWRRYFETQEYPQGLRRWLKFAAYTSEPPKSGSSQTRANYSKPKSRNPDVTQRKNPDPFDYGDGENWRKFLESAPGTFLQ